jgi:hypothetical protein
MHNFEVVQCVFKHYVPSNVYPLAQTATWAPRGKTNVYWGAVLIEAVRVDGKPRQRYVALGGFTEQRIKSVCPSVSWRGEVLGSGYLV